MPNPKEDLLRELGLSVNEAKVYLALLRIGCVSAGKIAEACKLHRTNVYDSLERLEEKGLVSFIMKEETKLFEAADPETFKHVLDERRARFDVMLPQLALDKQLGTKATAQVFEGISAWKIAAFNLLKHKQTIKTYGVPKNAPELMKHFVDMFHQTRIQKKILMQHLYNENAKERIKYLNGLQFTEAKYLPLEFDTPVTTTVCGNEVLITHWDADPVTFIRIENAALADVYRKYFDVLYAQGKLPDDDVAGKRKFSRK